MIVGTVKPTEWVGEALDELTTDKNWSWDQQTTIIRVVEQAGKDTIVKLIFNKNLAVEKIEEIDLLERNISKEYEVDIIPTQLVNQNIVTFTIKHFEIKTLRVVFKK